MLKSYVQVPETKKINSLYKFNKNKDVEGIQKMSRK